MIHDLAFVAIGLVAGFVSTVSVGIVVARRKLRQMMRGGMTL